MVILRVREEAPQEGARSIVLVTDWGELHCRYLEAPGALKACICVPGAIGGWHTPAEGLYPWLAQQLQQQGIATLRVHFRDPHSLADSTLDVLAAAQYLRTQGVESLALVGHSFGGAVAIAAAAASPTVRAVVTLATQSYGAIAASSLGPRCSLLLIHGGSDHVLPDVCSRSLYDRAQNPRRLILHPNADHNLDEVASHVKEDVYEWITRWLSGAPPQ